MAEDTWFFLLSKMFFMVLNFGLISSIFHNVAASRDSEVSDRCFQESCGRKYEPKSPLILCTHLPKEFIVCDPPFDLKGNSTAREELGYGCVKYGGSRYEDVEHTKVWCEALPGIECYGKTRFLVDGVPCIRYSGHYFLTTLLYSLLLGFLGVDRFCLGHTGAAVGKLLTIGGLGIWWFVDIILLVTGLFKPEDGSNWNTYY